MRIGCDKFAKRLLESCGCNEDCYRGIDITEIESDLRQYFTDNPECNYNNYPIYDIAVCLREIGDSVPLPPPKMWKVIWDGDSFTDGMECESFEAAKNDALETLAMWQCDQLMEMGVSSYDGWTEDQIEDWDCMIDSCACWVEKRREDVSDDCDEDERWEEYWWPTDEDCKDIGWLYYEELRSHELPVDKED